MESRSPWTGMPNTRTHISRVEQNLHTLTAAVESCRGDLRLLSDELLTSDNSARFYFEKCIQYHHLNQSLVQERDEAARDIEGLQRNAAVTHGDLLQQNELNEILQKRVFELERSQDDHIVEARNLKAKISHLEAGTSGTRWTSPIIVRLPYEDGPLPALSSESVLDLDAKGGEGVDIALDCGRGFQKTIHEYGRIDPTAQKIAAATGEISRP